MGKTEIKKKKSKSSTKKPLRDINLLESVNIKGLSDLETVAMYITKATELENSFKEDKALVFYDKCIEILSPKVNESPEHLEKLIKCLESSSYILIELGEQDKGKDRLHQVTVLNPDVGYEKYMFLAQLSEGINAVNLYEKGVQTIQQQILSSKDDAELLKKLNDDLSQSFCAIAEIYMTDLCDEENAESICRANIDKALKISPENPQAYLISAGLYTVKAQNEEAKTEIKKCLDFWWPPIKEFLNENKKEDKKDMEVDDANSDDDDEESMGGQIDFEELTGIPFEAHISMAKMLYELEMYQEAADVLEVLLEEDDENSEIFYILAKTGDKLNWKETHAGALRYYATFCKVVSAKLDDQEVVNEMQAILDTLPEPTSDEEDFKIPDTDEDSDMYEDEEMGDGEKGDESWETDEDSDAEAMNEDGQEDSDKDSGCHEKKEKS